MKLNFLFLPIAALMSFNCRKEFTKPTNIPGASADSSILKLIWATPVTDAKSYTPPNLPPIIAGDQVIFSRFAIGPKDPIVSFNATSGDRSWTWEDPIDIYDGEKISDMAVSNGRVAICSSHEISILDSKTGKTIWKTDAQNDGGLGSPRMSVCGEQIFHCRQTIVPGSCCVVQSAHLVATNMETSKWDTLFSISLDDNDGYSPSFESISIWKNPDSGDSILIFQNRQYLWQSNPPNGFGGRIDLIGFNLNKREIEWKTRINDPIGGSSINDLLILDDKAFFLGQTLLSCLNPSDGAIIWQKKFNQNWAPASGATETLLFAGLAIADGKLLVKPDNQNFYALNPFTGGEIWKTTNAGHSPGHIEVYKDLVLYASQGSEGIWIHRVSDGSLVERLMSPNRKDPRFPGASIQYCMKIDPENGVLYTNDGFFVLCYKIEK